MDEITQVGNECLWMKDYSDALWKYRHALLLCHVHKLPIQKIAILESNCSEACLRLGFYDEAYKHAKLSIEVDTDHDNAHKVIVNYCS